MTHILSTIHLHPWTVVFLTCLLGILTGLLLQKLSREQPVITTGPVLDPGIFHTRQSFMIVTDQKQFHFSARKDMEDFTSLCIMPFEMWEQDDKLTWHYLGGNRG